MIQNEPRYRPRAEETTPAGSPPSAETAANASAEVDQAAREIRGGSLRGELTQLGDDIDTLRIRVDREEGCVKHLQPELDDIKQQHRLAMEAMDQFESESAGEWDAFRTGMEQTHQELRDRLGTVRQRLPDTDSTNTNTKEEKS